jgi:hypothetical protein
MKNINEHILRISGKVCTDQPYELGEDYTINITGNIVKIEEHDNQDGTIDVIYVMKPEMIV